jgi:PKD repeat protein
MNISRPLILAGLLLPGITSAQTPTVLCATDIMRARAIAENPEFLLEEAQLMAEIDELMHSSVQDRGGNQVYTIPVVFHVLHLGGKENIGDDQILNAMSILNRDFAKLNADTISVHPSMRDRIADMRIQFTLATRDPQGGCTNGIVRYRTAETLRGESTSKIDPWPRSRYMNVWIVDRIISGAAGYFSGGPAWGDGIVLLHDYTGAIGTGQVGRSRALTHEVGHYLNLSHVWGSNNGVPDPNTPIWAMQAVCGDDGVEDTPITRGWSSCQASANPTRPWGDCDQQSFKVTVGDELQSGIRYDFANVTTGSGSTDPTAAPVVRDSIDLTTVRVSGSAFTAVGVSGNSNVAGRFGFTNWNTGANDGETDYANLSGDQNSSLGKYYQFSITPTLQQQSSIYSFAYTMGRSDNGPRTFAVRSSQNNYATNLPVSGTGIAIQPTNIGFIADDATNEITITCDPPVSGFTSLEQAITFRIYAWNSEDAAGSFIIDDVVIAGESATIENVENYMEYSYCSKMFTNGQRDRARSALQSTTTQRANLWTDANLQLTGVAEGFEATCPPQADFYCQVGSDPTNPNVPYAPFSCTNTNVRFFDNSGRSFPTAWSWTFQDGVPATSSQRNPTVQFSSTGWKTVTLTASNDNGSDTKTDNYAVYVGGPDVAFTPYYESFETGTGSDPYPYLGVNYEDNFTQFRRFEGGGATGNACVWLNSGSRNLTDFIDPDNVGDYDDLYTPLFNMTGAPSTTLSFRYAYNTNTNTTADITERLIIDSSTDCGRTWLNRADITGTQLVTNGTSSAIPPQFWNLRTISLPGSVITQNVRFRFRFISSQWSGNLFIDDIWMGVPVGINEVGANAFISLYPNPAHDLFNVQVLGMESSPTVITITDMRGAEVFSKAYQPNGSNGIEISSKEAGLSDGMYMLRAQNKAGSSAQKLVVGQ